MGIIQTRLKEYRKSRKLTQAKVAQMLGVTQQAYQEWESGTIEDLRSSTVIRLCETLGISADWLLGIGESKVIEFKEPLWIGLDVGNSYTAIQAEPEPAEESTRGS